MPRLKVNKFTAPSSVTTATAPATLSSVPPHVSSPRSSVVASTSDDSDGIIHKSRSGRNLHGIPRQDVFMSGALEGQRPARGTRPRRGVRAAPTRQPEYEDKIAALKRRKEEAEARARKEEVQVPASQPQKAAPAALAQMKDTSPAVGVSPRAVHVKPAPTTVEKPKVGLATGARAQPTPSSVLSLAKFKRRPRENSILRIGPEDESLSLTSLGGDFEDSFGDLDRLVPLDASTPFKSATSRPQPTAPTARMQTALIPCTPSNPPTSGSRKRKITPPENTVAQSQPPTSTPLSVVTASPPGSEAKDSSDHEEPGLPSPKRRAVPPREIFSDTMAPPQSSSPSRTPMSPVKSAPKAAVKQVVPAAPKPRTRDDRALRAASPAAKPSKKKSDQPRPMSTSALQNLLPRRRVTSAPRDEFDLSSSDASESIDEDADELSFLPSKQRKRLTTSKTVTAKKPQPRPAKSATAKTPAKAGQSRIAKSALKSKAKAKQAALAKTFGRRVSDKENHAGAARPSTSADSSLTSLGEHTSPSSALNSSSVLDLPEPERKKLSRLARKFKEVDKWEMSFEDVTASSSSPRDAR